MFPPASLASQDVVMLSFEPGPNEARVEAATMFASSEEMDTLLATGNYEGAIDLFKRLPLDARSERVFTNIVLCLVEDDSYFRSLPRLFSLMPLERRNPLAFNISDQLLGDALRELDLAQKKVRDLCAELLSLKDDFISSRKRLLQATLNSIRTLSLSLNCPPLAAAYEIEEVARSAYFAAREFALQKLSHLTIVPLTIVPHLAIVPSVTANLVVAAFTHPEVDEARAKSHSKCEEHASALRQALAMASTVEHSQMQALFQTVDSLRTDLQAAETCEPLAAHPDVKAAEETVRVNERAVKSAFFQVRRLIHELDDPLWRQALTLKLFAHVVTEQARNELGAWLAQRQNSPTSS